MYKNFPKKIHYFDNNATTFVYDPVVVGEVNKWLNCGNPSNTLHSAGLTAKLKLDKSREKMAKLLSVNPTEIIFTGSATEANNIIIQGIINEYLIDNPFEYFAIITTNFEHPSVLNIFNYYEKNVSRINVLYIPIITDTASPYYGTVDPRILESIVKNSEHKVVFMSIMYANNETGAIQDMISIGKISKKYNIHFHSDVTQAIGKFVIYPHKLGLDSMSFSGHKFHAPKGIGCLYKKNNCKLSKMCYGGEQENHDRPGTENIAFIAGITSALEIAHTDRREKTVRMYAFRKYLKNQLEKINVPCIEPKFAVLPNTLLAILLDINVCNKTFARELSQQSHVCIGVSSACQTGTVSHVLNAMKINKKYRDKIIRISTSDYTTIEECNYLIDGLKNLLKKYRK